MRRAMQSDLTSPAMSMTSGIAIHGASVARLVDTGAGRPLGRPAVPRAPLRERLRRPLLVFVPIRLAAAGTAYYFAQEPYVTTDDAFVRAAKESVNARVAG